MVRTHERSAQTRLRFLHRSGTPLSLAREWSSKLLDERLDLVGQPDFKLRQRSLRTGLSHAHAPSPCIPAESLAVSEAGLCVAVAAVKHSIGHGDLITVQE